MGYRKSAEEVRMDRNEWKKITSREENKLRSFIVAKRVNF